jgi:rubredoxin
MRIGKLRGNWKAGGTWLRKNATQSTRLASLSMDTDFVEQFVCSDCHLVYGEILAFDSNQGIDRICPRCGAGNGAVAAIECIYNTAQASLIRL